METASFSQGEVLSYTNIAQEVGNNRHTVKSFFDILEDLLIGNRLPVFTKRAKHDVVKHPKFYYFDVGVYRIFRPQGPLDTTEEIDGAALETLFLQEAKSINDYYELGYEFYYWRTRSQSEVDLTLYGKKGLCAFEIKHKIRLTQKAFKGLNTFSKDYPMAKLYLLYGGDKSYFENVVRRSYF